MSGKVIAMRPAVERGKHYLNNEELEEDEEEEVPVGRRQPEQGVRRRFPADEQSPVSSPDARHENSPPHYDSPTSSRSNSSYTPPAPYPRNGYDLSPYRPPGTGRGDHMHPGARGLGGHARNGPVIQHDFPAVNWRGPPAPSSPLLRKGKWTAEEEAYVERIILDFSRGFLALPSGTTLRGFLSEKLNW